jgi:hypothetical protein
LGGHREQNKVQPFHKEKISLHFKLKEIAVFGIVMSGRNTKATKAH